MSEVDRRLDDMLSPTELIDFEARCPKHTSSKELAIMDDLHLRPARYYQLLHAVARSEAGMQHDALTCRRIRDRLAAAA